MERRLGACPRETSRVYRHRGDLDQRRRVARRAHDRFDLLGHIYEMPFAGGEARRLTRPVLNHLPRYSPDGTRIMFTSDRRGKEGIWLYHRGNDSLEMVSKGDERTYQGAWTGDGRGYYAVTGDMGGQFGASRFDFSAPARCWCRRRRSRRRPRSWRTPRANGFSSRSPRARSTPTASSSRPTILRPAKSGSSSRAAAAPRRRPWSKDGKWLAYIHRDDQETVLILHELATGRERVLLRGLDRDRQESGAGTTYGAYPSMAWHPSGQERSVVFYGGHLHAVNATTGATRDIPFRAPVRRELSGTLRFPVTQPVSGKATTRSHRFGVRTDRGVVYEALGDLWLKDGGSSNNLTKSAALRPARPTIRPPTRSTMRPGPMTALARSGRGPSTGLPRRGGSPPCRRSTAPSRSHRTDTRSRSSGAADRCGARPWKHRAPSTSS